MAKELTRLEQAMSRKATRLEQTMSRKLSPLERVMSPREAVKVIEERAIKTVARATKRRQQ